MALTKPIVNDIAAFDATQIGTITFTATATDGSIINGNEIKVVINDISETVIYSHTVSSHALSHTIPANTLTNGIYYKVAIRTIDEINNKSEWSNYQPFYCYATPSLTFENISSGSVVTTSQFTFKLLYSQAQNERVNYVIIKLYNNNNVLISDSGNLYDSSTTMPLRFSYTVNGLQTNRGYKVKATAVTVNNTIVETGLIPFTVDYSQEQGDNKLTATLDSCNGYINLKSNIITNVEISSNPDPLIYIDDDNKADLINTVADIEKTTFASWARWNKLEIPNNFLLRMWFYPSRQPFEVLKITNEGILDGNKTLKVYFERGSTTDYISIRGENIRIDRPLNAFCNGNTRVFLWMKVVGTTWDVQCDVLNSTATILEWTDAPNASSSNTNIEYNVTTDITWGSEPYGTFTPASNLYSAMFEATTVWVGNGIFDELNITKDTSISYTSDIPTNTPQTLLKVDFNGNIGTTDYYTRLLLKRKDNTTDTWLNIVDINNIPYGEPTLINYDDSFIPTNVEQTYGLVSYINNVATEMVTVSITPTWGKYFISDKDNKFPLNYAVIYSNHNQNIQNGVFMPIGAKYPTVIQNAKGNYRSGSMQFTVLGYRYDIDARLDRQSIVQQTNDMLAFLTNGKAKCITDFNGNIFIIKVINSPQISYDANWGNGVTSISFDWVEQGKYNNQDDMVEVGLFDYIAE